MKRSRLRCACRHGYGTHRLALFALTVIPMECRSAGCPCVRYERTVDAS